MEPPGWRPRPTPRSRAGCSRARGRRRRRRRPPRPAVRGALVVKEGAGYGGGDDVAVDLRVDDHAGPGRRAGPAARPQRPLPHGLDRGGEGAAHRRAEEELEEFAQAPGARTSQAWAGTENYEMRVAPDAGSTRRSSRSSATEPVSVLAIDAGTTGVTALVVDRGRPDRRQGYQEFAQHFPQPGWVEHAPEEIWQATLEATRDACCSGRRVRAQGGRHHQPARDGPALGPRDPRLAAARDRLAGPAYRRHLRPAARRRSRGAGRRADRAAARPVLHRHQADLARRERAAHLGAGRVGPLRRRHRRLLPDRPDDPRHVPRHRRLQRLPHAAVRPRRRRLVRRAVRAVRRAPRRAARGGPVLGRGRHHRPAVVPRPGAADRRARRRPAVRAVRADLLRRRATPSAPTAPGRSSSSTPAPSSCAPTPGCSRPRPGGRRTAT